MERLQLRKVAVPALLTLGGLVVAALLVFVIVIGPWLFTRFPQADLTAEQVLKAKNDVRTTLVQAFVGIAVASGALVTYRTFRYNRLEHDRTYSLEQAEQINEFFIKAVDRLGDEHAPVRLGAMYSLVQLAQDNPERRPSVSEVLCGYLRMPFATLSEDSSPGDRQELQVRLIAQQLLAAHLRPLVGTPRKTAHNIKGAPDERFWPGISLDLIGATLIDWTFQDAEVAAARFDGATFAGSTSFARTVFRGDARFTRANFDGNALFAEAEFKRAAYFDDVAFQGGAHCVGAVFDEDTNFTQATFLGDARFDRAVFEKGALFRNATLSADALFGRATFNGDARFGRTTFARLARFAEVEFNGVAGFADAEFAGTAGFTGATFSRGVKFYHAVFTRDARFDGATFTNDAGLRGARVLHLDDVDLARSGDGARRIWPRGWRVRPEWDDPTRGALVRSQA
ncbi:pentapeptide repeat-containing protein [Symbioplanes lichenis]|uniref:pentapeptide repeat-containing protein n=1 Tax=Symbioplanes lichenis TaxID=1629072 RepID=UPI002738C9F4|nr:pentapeptide repeat-containing protein [Actinoplanes lichenis]